MKTAAPRYNRYVKKRTTLERIKVVGPMSESKDVMAELHADGWTINRSGPYTDRKIFPDVDMERFLFMAEREA